MAKKNVQKDTQQSTKHTHKNKDRVTRTPLKTWGELQKDKLWSTKHRHKAKDRVTRTTLIYCIMSASP